MHDLIPLCRQPVGADTVETFNARDLHAHLQVGKDFSTWIKAQIKRARLVENRDYIVFPPEGGKLESTTYGHGKTAIEYHLTLKAGEHIGMVSGTAKGFEIREWFIARANEALKNRTSALDRYPELKAMTELMVGVAEARDRAAQAEAEAKAATLAAHVAQIQAARADAKVEALADTQRMTVEHFVLANGLLQKFPYDDHRRVSDWLMEFCLQYAWEVPKVSVYGKPWTEEKAFPLPAFSAWMRHEVTRFKQQSLRVLRTKP